MVGLVEKVLVQELAVVVKERVGVDEVEVLLSGFV